MCRLVKSTFHSVIEPSGLSSSVPQIEEKTDPVDTEALTKEQRYVFESTISYLLTLRLVIKLNVLNR